MSESNTQTDATEESTYAVDYEAAAALPEGVSLSQSEAVTGVTETLSEWADAETDHDRVFRTVKYDPQRPALHISVRVSGIPGSTPPNAGYAQIQSLLDGLRETLDADFGAARDVAEVR